MNKQYASKQLTMKQNNQLFTVSYLNRPQHLRERIIAIKPRRYFSLNAYRMGLMQLFAEPSHCAIGVKMLINSSILGSSGPPTSDTEREREN